MFQGAAAFNQDISDWNVVSVTSTAGWYISRVSENLCLNHKALDFNACH